MMAALPFKDINVHASASYYAFSSPSTPSAPTLLVDRPSGELRLTNEKMLGCRRVSAIGGILGIISLGLVVTKAITVGRINGNTVCKVTATESLPLRDKGISDHDEDQYLAMLHILLKSSPLYYSYTFDLTSRLQRQAEADASLAFWQRADDRFFWNRFIQSDLINFRNGKGSRFSKGREQPVMDAFILPVIFGMLEIRNTSIKGAPLTYILISRRSRFRVGTRYFSRGIDDDGNVSNFNETEQIIILNDESSKGPLSYQGDSGIQYDKLKAAVGKEVQVLSYVQTRGSVPVYWAEVSNLKYTPSLMIRPIDNAISAAAIHFDSQIKTYGDNYLVNLVNAKGREQRVKEAYELVVRTLAETSAEEADQRFRLIESRDKNHFDRLHYIYFDFHTETKGLRWHRTQLLLQQLEQPLVDHGYFRAVDMPGVSGGKLEIRRRQTATVRTNCMDCLDRTNLVQSMIARFVLARMLVDLGVLREGERTDGDVAFEHLFRNIWADNADVVSRAYSGTGALKTDFTRTGQRTKRGEVMDVKNSVTRYVKNNFLDGPRQDGFDLFLGVYRPRSSPTGSVSVFVDRRPISIQSVPYVLLACIIFLLVGFFTRQDDATSVWPLRIVMMAALVTATLCFQFVFKHGMLYVGLTLFSFPCQMLIAHQVNWPKLNTPSWASDGFNDSMAHARTSPLMGPFVKTHERGRSEAKVGFMEEGKERRE